MNDHTIKAIRLLGEYTRGRFRIWELAGDSNSAARASVMAALLGLPKIAKAKAGVNAIAKEFYQQLAIVGSCDAVREDALVDACKRLAADAAVTL